MKHVQDLNQELIVTKLNFHTPMLLQAKYYSISISSLQYVLIIGPPMVFLCTCLNLHITMMIHAITIAFP